MTPLLERLCRLAVRLHPPAFRRRYEAEMRRAIDAATKDATDGKRGRRVLLGYLVDALLTLPKVWVREARAERMWGAPLRAPASAIRALRRRPTYTLVIVLTLALALGANTAIFSVTHAVLLRSLPYAEPERVVRAEPAPIGASGAGPLPWGVHPDFASHPAVAATTVFLPHASANLVDGARAMHVDVVQVDSDFFEVLGVDLVLGGGLQGGSEGGGRVVLSHRLWTRDFGADDGILGRTLNFSGHPFEVVGVAPRGVRFPGATEAWLSFPVEPDFFGGAFGPEVLARVVPGVDRTTLVTVLEARLEEQYASAPPSIERPEVAVTPLENELTGSVRAPLWILMGSAGALLLLGCLNLMSVVLSRVSDRRAELRVRVALGAGRGHVFGDLLAEVAILAVLGGAVGLGLAHFGMRALAGWLPSETPGLDSVGLSTPVLLFALAASVLAALLAGTFPAATGAGTSGLPRPKRRVTPDASAARVQSWLIVGQVCVASVLAVGAVLLGRSLRQLTAVPLGYETEQIVTFRVRLPAGAYPDGPSRTEYVDRVLLELERLARASAVGAVSRLPLTSGLWRGTTARLEPGADPISAIRIETAGAYFETMGTPVLAGRPFEESDDPVAGEVVVSASLARALFGDGPAVGRTFFVPTSPTEFVERRVRAVVGDVRMRARRVEDRQAVMYDRLDRAPVPFPAFVVRSDPGPGTAELMTRIREVLRTVDPTVPPIDLQPAEESVAEELATHQAAAVLTALFSGSALLLVALGLYGLLSQRVARRRRELGVRVALGATGASVVRSLVARGLAPTAVGAALGLSSAVLLSGLLEDLLFEVPARDPANYLVVAATVVGVAFVSAYVPARRAAGLDPAESLRVE